MKLRRGRPLSDRGSITCYMQVRVHSILYAHHSPTEPVAIGTPLSRKLCKRSFQVPTSQKLRLAKKTQIRHGMCTHAVQLLSQPYTRRSSSKARAAGGMQQANPTARANHRSWSLKRTCVNGVHAVSRARVANH